MPNKDLPDDPPILVRKTLARTQVVHDNSAGDTVGVSPDTTTNKLDSKHSKRDLRQLLMKHPASGSESSPQPVDLMSSSSSSEAVAVQ